MKALPLTQAHAKARREAAAAEALLDYHQGLLPGMVAEERIINAGYVQAEARRMIERLDHEQAMRRMRRTA